MIIQQMVNAISIIRKRIGNPAAVEICLVASMPLISPPPLPLIRLMIATEEAATP